MFESIRQALAVINFQLFLVAALFFIIGYTLAPTVYYKNIKWLTAYPFFIIKLLEKYFKASWHPMKIFAVLFTLNSVSLYINLLSGYGLFLPVLFVIYLGINVGVVIYHNQHGQYYYTSLLNPVALLELPASWISITMAMQYSLKANFHVDWLTKISFTTYSLYFTQLVLPLLFLAGIIETYLIVLSRRKMSDDDEF